MRIKIKGDYIREEFFNSIKLNLNKSWKEIRKELGVSKTSFDNYKSGKLLLPDKLFYSLLESIDEIEKKKIVANIENLQDNFGQINGGKKAYAINFEKFKEGRKKGATSLRKISQSKRIAEKIEFDNLELTPEICEFIGAFIGDGCFNHYKNNVYHIEFAGDKRYDMPYYKENIIPTIQSISSLIKPHIYIPPKKENAMRIVFYSRTLFYFLKDFAGFVPGKKTFTVYIPDKIINAGEKFINSTIRGVFDTDGGVFLDKRKNYKTPYPRIFLQTVSKPLYDQVHFYLSKEFNLYTRFNEKRQIYIIEIYGIQQLRKWTSLIGFSNKRHLDKVASMAQR